MNRHFCAVALISLLGLAAPAQAVVPGGTASDSNILVGAYAPVPVDDPLVREAKAFVQERFPSLALERVNVAYTQVVAGMNVKLIGTGLEEGRQVTWKFVVYTDLDGRMTLSVAERL